MPDFEAAQDLLNIYVEDARAHLDGLDHCLLSLERDGFDAEQVAAVLGPLHTLKGNSGMMGFGRVKDYVHRLEDAFAAVRDGRLALDAPAFDALFAGSTALRDAVERACGGQGEVRDLLPEKAALDRLLARAPDEGSGRGQQLLPPKGRLAEAAVPAPPQRSAEHYVSGRSSMVRVDFGQLDHLLNLVGELIIHRTKLHDVARELARQLGGGSQARELAEAVQQVANVSSRLQETVMDIRMLPIRHVFDRFPRLVRDLAHEQGKDIELILEGQGTRVDKAIIDEIGEPLVHMIRNAIDHGIEPPAQRIAHGKTPTGTIMLTAAQESNHVVVSIADDGAGIDADRVRRRALESGLINADQAISDRDVVQLVFAQGFSTRTAVTEVSGRGVGLDVVLQAIERLNGLVEVETVVGVGTRFSIQLPLTLAIISALLVETGGRAYAVPLGSVVESLRLRDADVHSVNGRPALRLRERIVPLVPLTELLGLPEAETEERYCVVLGRGDKRVGLVVGRLQGQQEVVIKALDPSVSGQAYAVAGATIMGDGRVVLILDVSALFDARRRLAPRAGLQRAAG